MNINNLVSFHFVLPQKKLKLIKRIAKNKQMLMSEFIRNIFAQYRLLMQNRQLCKSPKKSKIRCKIVNKVESRVYISKEDYDFLTQNMLLNNYPSRAEFFREIIFAYLEQLLDCGKNWFEQKSQQIKHQIEQKFAILKKNHSVIRKRSTKYKHLYNLRSNGKSIFEVEFVS